MRVDAQSCVCLAVMPLLRVSAGTSGEPCHTYIHSNSQRKPSRADLPPHVESTSITDVHYVQAVSWFERNFAMVYDPGSCGSISDWLLDLVSVGFGDSSSKVGFRSAEELQQAAKLFLEAQPGVTEDDKLQTEAPGELLVVTKFGD